MWPSLRHSSMGLLTFVIGTFGLVAPIAEAVPSLEATMGISLAPLLLYFAGQTLEDLRDRMALGPVLQRVSGLAFLTLWSLVFLSTLSEPSEAGWLGVFLGGVGVPMAQSVLMARPEVVVVYAPGSLGWWVNTLGYDGIGLTLVSVGFVVAGAVIVWNEPGEPKGWASTGFFLGCTLVGLHEWVVRLSHVKSPGPVVRTLGRGSIVTGGLLMVASGLALFWL